jgi:hypothetical protein
VEHPQEIEETPAVVAPRGDDAALDRDIEARAQRVVEGDAVGGYGTLAVLRSACDLRNQRDVGDW